MVEEVVVVEVVVDILADKEVVVVGSLYSMLASRRVHMRLDMMEHTFHTLEPFVVVEGQPLELNLKSKGEKD